MSAEAGAPGTEEKIAPEMIEARIKALRGELVNGEISEAFLADAVCTIYSAMKSRERA